MTASGLSFASASMLRSASSAWRAPIAARARVTSADSCSGSDCNTRSAASIAASKLRVASSVPARTSAACLPNSAESSALRSGNTASLRRPNATSERPAEARLCVVGMGRQVLAEQLLCLRVRGRLLEALRSSSALAPPGRSSSTRLCTRAGRPLRSRPQSRQFTHRDLLVPTAPKTRRVVLRLVAKRGPPSRRWGVAERVGVVTRKTHPGRARKSFPGTAEPAFLGLGNLSDAPTRSHTEITVRSAT